MSLSLDNPIFAAYEKLAATVDSLFLSVQRAHPDCVKCRPGCDDCCHALFDLPLVEALYVNQIFVRDFPLGPARSQVLERAGKADREAHIIKRRVFKESQAGKESAAILEEVGRLRVRCPLLDSAGECLIYEHRPLTCRAYGVPVRIGNAAHTCSLSAFQGGQSYPTLDMDRLQASLAAMSEDLAHSLNSSYKDLSKVFVPLSLALLTDYSDEYLGIKKS